MQTIEDQIAQIKKKIAELKEKKSEADYEIYELQNQLQALIEKRTFPKIREKVLL